MLEARTNDVVSITPSESIRAALAVQNAFHHISLIVQGKPNKFLLRIRMLDETSDILQQRSKFFHIVIKDLWFQDFYQDSALSMLSWPSLLPML